jgi:hypothetical protein
VAQNSLVNEVLMGLKCPDFCQFIRLYELSHFLNASYLHGLYYLLVNKIMTLIVFV